MAVRKKRNLKGVVILALCAAAAVLGIVCVSIFHSGRSALYADGLAYLDEQASRDVTELENTLSVRQRERLLEAVRNNETSIFSLFGDAVFLGDSRVYGFGSYGFMPQDQVLAAAGNTIENAADYLSQIEAKKPDTIYVSYGVNDMGLDIGSALGENGYAQVFEQQMDEILKVSPDSKIVVNSIIACSPATLEKNPRWGKTGDFNAQLKTLCEKRGWVFVDNGSISGYGQADIYQPDGVHFQSNFYPVWAENMLETAYSTGV